MQRSHSWLFFLGAIEGAVAITALLLIPSEDGRLSLARLAMLSVLLAFVILWTYLGIRPPRSLDGFAHPAFIVISALLSLTFSLSLFLLRYLDPERLLPVYERLSPLLWYFLVLSVQAAIFLLVLYKGFHPTNLYSRKPVYTSALIAFCALLAVFALVVFTRLGITPDTGYWGEPGVPLLGWQFALALIGGLCVLCISLLARTRFLDVFLPLVIYILALVIWLSVPVDVLTGSFYMPITAPAFQPFPYSDSTYYDQMAHSLLIGHPYLGSIPTRPLYIFFLTILHLLVGENYRLILAAQTFVLALMPVLLYFIGRKVHSRAAGVTVALFFIFRELTSQLISSNTRVTNTKMILVDLPTLFLLLAACLFAFRWLERKDGRSALIAGGTFGLLLLLRTQSTLVLPLIVLAALLVLGWRKRSTYVQVATFVLGLAVAILPWLTHNYLLTGEFAFDAAFQYRTIASQYAYSGNLDISNYDFEGRGLGSVLIEFALKDPKFVFGFIANHFLAAQIHGLLALPLFEPYNGIFAPINLYWMDWNGTLAWYNALLLILYLAVISFGLGAAWRRWRWLGLLPLVFSLGYALATAVGRFSSWRYDFPADWISYFYFGVGFAELLGHAALLFGARIEVENASPEQVSVSTTPRPRMVNGVVLALMFVLLGSLPWMIKNIAAPRYSDQSTETLSAGIAALSNAPTREEINAFVLQPDAFLQTGRLLYPRFFYRDDGLTSTNPASAYAIREYERLGFVLLNQSFTQAVFPLEKMPGPVPHAADVIVLGCRRESYVEVRMLAIPELDAVYVNEHLTEPCD